VSLRLICRRSRPSPPKESEAELNPIAIVSARLRAVEGDSCGLTKRRPSSFRVPRLLGLTRSRRSGLSVAIVKAVFDTALFTRPPPAVHLFARSSHGDDARAEHLRHGGTVSGFRIAATWCPELLNVELHVREQLHSVFTSVA